VPDLGDRPPAVVVGDLLRRQVAVVVDDRLPARVLLVEIDRGLAVEEEVVVEELFHGRKTQNAKPMPAFRSRLSVNFGAATWALVEKTSARLSPSR
jgi:hypothetical protein